MAGKEEVIWGYLVRKGARPRKDILSESIFIYKKHPEWDLYIVREGEPERWGFKKTSWGFKLYAREFLNLNPAGADDKRRSKSKPAYRESEKNNPDRRDVKEEVRYMNKAEEYCKFLKKLPVTMRKWSSVEPGKTKSSRERLLKKFGEFAFLDLKNLKYPIITRRGEFSPKGLLAAYKRAKQWGDDEVADLALEVGKCMGLTWALMNPSEVQSILFDRKKWNLKKARKWLKEHGFKYHNYERTENYYHFTQESPEKFERLRFKDFGNGIKAIIGFTDLNENPFPAYNKSMARYKMLYKKYLDDGEKLLEAGDYVQASEKFWGAAAEIVKAVAAKRGKYLGAHNMIEDFVLKLDKENPSLGLFHLFTSAEGLHRNFYENNSFPDVVKKRAEDVREFIEKMEKLLND